MAPPLEVMNKLIILSFMLLLSNYSQFHVIVE